jgi:hypothetical protein
MKANWPGGDFSMVDPLAAMCQRIVDLLSQPRTREELEAVFRQVWDERQVLQDYEVLGFTGERMDVCRKSDGALGSLGYQDSPRFYFCFIGTL